MLATGGMDRTIKFWGRNIPGEALDDRYSKNMAGGQDEDDDGDGGDWYPDSGYDSRKRFTPSFGGQYGPSKRGR